MRASTNAGVMRAAAWTAISAAAPVHAGSPANAATRNATPNAQRERAIGADPAVLHDGEPLLDGPAAAKPVGGIGEAVLMQRAGDDDAGRHRQ